MKYSPDQTIGGFENLLTCKYSAYKSELFAMHPKENLYLSVSSYYFMDTCFAFSLFFFLTHVFRNHYKCCVTFSYGLPGLLLVVDFVQNVIGCSLLSDQSLENIYDCLRIAKLILILCASVALVSLFVLDFTSRKLKDSALDFFRRISFGLIITLGIMWLLRDIDQGKIMLIQLVNSKWNLLASVLLLMMIFWMTVVNTYYSSVDNFKNFASCLKKSSCRYFQKIYPVHFKWSEFKDEEALKRHTTQQYAFAHRIFALSHVWVAIAVLYYLQSSIWPDTHYEIGGSGLWFIILLIFFVFSLLWTWKAPDELSKGNFKVACLASWSLGFVIAGLSIIVYSMFIENGAHYQIEKIRIGLLGLMLISCGQTIFLTYRRRVGLLKTDIKWFKNLVCFFANDVNSKVLQAFLSICILFFCLGVYISKSEIIYEINSINIILAAIVVVFTYGQLLISYRTKLQFVNEFSDEETKANNQDAKTSKTASIGMDDLPESEQSLKAAIKLIQDSNTKGKYLISLVVSFLPIILLVFTDSAHTNYNEMPTLKNDQNGISLLEYLEELKDCDEYFMIANEGGGLRANYWTLKVLDSLDNKLNGKLYERTIATSGASGGGIGQGLFNIMKQSDLDESDRKAAIEQIGCTDFLSRDVYSFLLPRFVGRMLGVALDPEKINEGNWVNRRGDILQAQKYAEISSNSSNDNYNNSFNQFWYDAYLDSEKSFPLTIIHSTHVLSGMEGIISPLKDEKQIFSGYNFVNDLNGSSLSYINSLFLTNRFPVVSPVASIQTKGQYNDAGAFDNIGLSSLIDLVLYVHQRSKDTSSSENERWKQVWEKIGGRIKIILIHNSEETYIFDYFSNIHGDNIINELHQINNGSNVQSNVSSALSLSAVKNYLKNQTGNLKGPYFSDVVSINLPYMIENKTKVDKIFGGQINPGFGIWDSIHSHDSCLVKNLKVDGQVYLKPALGRVLSKPLQSYMDSAALKIDLDKISTCNLEDADHPEHFIHKQDRGS